MFFKFRETIYFERQMREVGLTFHRLAAGKASEPLSG